VENAAVAASADAADQQAGDANAGRNGSRGEAANQSAFPLTLVSNDDLRLFKVYGCFDDFEQRPLHGTFLIDKDRRVRWHETGAEPFQDAAFLLEEAKRLIALPSP
jgi:peroxiredoxin